MVSTTKMAVMVICVLISIAALAIPTWQIKLRSSKLETGLAGAIGYGFLGYIWQYVIYWYAGTLLLRFLVPKNQEPNVTLLEFLITFISTGCTAVSLYWGIYLTNQKQLSIYRSAAIGIGFSLGKIGIDLIYPYATSFYFSLQLNAGTFQGDDALGESIVNTTISSMLTSTYKCLLMFAIIFVLALIMGFYYLAGKKKMAMLFVLGVYEIIMLINVGLKFVFGRISKNAVDISIMVVFSVFALWAVLILYHWFRTDEVEWNPRKLLQKR